MSLIISFEGLPNSGKSTASELLKEKLCQNGIKTIVLDADNFADGAAIRNIANKYRLGHFSRALLYWFLQFQQEDAIEYYRESVDVIIADRFWGSVSAVDGSSGVPRDLLELILSYSTKPDLTFFLDIPLEIASERKVRKSILTNDIQTAEKIERKYKKLALRENWFRIDASEKKEDICDKCFSQVTKKLDKMIEYGKTPYCLSDML